MFKKTFGCLIFLLLAIGVRAQVVRYDNDAFTTAQVQSVGIFTTVLAPSPQALIYVCAHPANGVPCTNLVQTYTDITGTTQCPNTTQLTPFNGNVCIGTADLKGNFGFWIPPGTYDYTVCPQGQFACLGPYPISVSPVTSSGGGGVPSISTFSGTSDAVSDPTCSMASGSAQLTCTDGPFTSCPTGKSVSVTGAGLDSGGNAISLIGTITGCSSISTAVLSSSSSHTTPSPTTARWGTNNFTAMKSQYASAGTKTFIIPPGNYLIDNHFSTGAGPIPLTSNTEFVIQKGATIFWVGPVGSPFVVSGGEGNIVLFSVGDGNSNIHLRIDGAISGDNVFGSSGVPAGNQSQLLSVSNAFTAPINNIQIDGTGIIENIYGFDIHTIGGATGNVSFSGLRVNISGKGTNINSPGYQRGLYLYKSFGLETATSGAIIENNTFDTSGGISLGGAGGSCVGNVVANNSWLNGSVNPGNSGINLSIADCVTNATVTGNSFYVSGANGVGISLHNGSFAGTGGHVISGNTFTCGGQFPNEALAAIVNSVSATAPGTMFVNNYVNSDPAFANSYCNYGVLEENTASTDTFIGGLYSDGGHGLSDFSVQGGANVLADGVQLPDGGPQVISSTVDTRSSFILPTLRTGYFGPIDTTGVPNVSGNTQIGYPTIGASSQTGVNGFWLAVPAATASGVTSATVQDCKVSLTTAAGNVACAVYDSNGSSGSPGTVLCQNGTGIPAVANSINVIPISGCPTLSSGHLYYAVVGFSSAVTGINHDANSPPFYFVGSVSCCTSFTTQTFISDAEQYTVYLDVIYSPGPPLKWGATYNASNPIPANFLAPALIPTSINGVAYADQFTGADCGIKINNALAGSSNVIVTPDCGTIATQVNITTSDVTLHFVGGVYNTTASIAMSSGASHISIICDGSVIQTATNALNQLLIGDGTTLSANISVEGCTFGNTGTSTGTAITVNKTNNIVLDNITIGSYATGLLAEGASYATTLSNFNIGSCTTACINLSNGTNGTAAELVVHDGYMSGSGSGVSFEWVDGGGVYFTNVSILSGSHGIEIIPGTSNGAIFGFFTNVAADSATNSNWYIAPSSSGLIKHLVMTNCWGSSSSAGAGVTIGGTSTTTIDSIEWDSGRVVNNYSNGIELLGGGSVFTNIHIRNGYAQNNSTHGSALADGINVGAGVTHFSIEGVTTGPATGASNLQAYGIIVNTGASDYYIITGNDTVGNVTGGILDSGSGAHKVVTNNL